MYLDLHTNLSQGLDCFVTSVSLQERAHCYCKSLLQLELLQFLFEYQVFDLAIFPLMAHIFGKRSHREGHVLKSNTSA